MGDRLQQWRRCGGGKSILGASFTAARAAGAITHARRGQQQSEAGLLKLLDDPDDAFLAAVRSLDMPRIVAIAQGGPNAALAAAMLRRRTVAPGSQPSSFPATPSDSPAEAVLESLRVHGLSQQQRATEEEQRELAQQQEQQLKAAGSSDDAAAAAAECWARHVWEGLCALNAVLRMQMESVSWEEVEAPPTPPSQEEMDAAYALYLFIMSHAPLKYIDSSAAAVPAGTEGDWRIGEACWREDYVEELEQLGLLFQAAGDPRAIQYRSSEAAK